MTFDQNVVILPNHSLLNQMVISQLKDVRTASKAFSTAQSSAMQVLHDFLLQKIHHPMQDLVKWGLKDENRAIQDAVTQVRNPQKSSFQTEKM